MVEKTAEMPDMYAANDYDLAGTVTGIAEKEELLTTAGPQKVIFYLASHQAACILMAFPLSGRSYLRIIMSN